jgi:REP-associated tyrosine transposase
LRACAAPVSRPKRLANHSYVGRFQYSLTFCTWKRRRLFEDTRAVAETQAHVQRTATEESFAVLAYCFMPDHVHLLVRGVTEKSDLRRFVKSSKERSGRTYRKRFGDRLWQEGYFERVLRNPGDARECAEYIVNNPVRAGLVANATEYEYAAATEWTIDELTAGVLDNEVQNAGPTEQARPTRIR